MITIRVHIKNIKNIVEELEQCNNYSPFPLYDTEDIINLKKYKDSDKEFVTIKECNFFENTVEFIRRYNRK